MLLGLYIAIGAITGAILRWRLSLTMNSWFPVLPLGTLFVNILGGFLIGMFIGITKNHTFIPEGLRLMLVTGFLGSLTTFSTFSAETVSLMMSEQYIWSFLAIIVHVAGSLIATVLGVYLIKFFMFLGS